MEIPIFCPQTVEPSLMHCYTAMLFNITVCNILTYILKKFSNKNS